MDMMASNDRTPGNDLSFRDAVREVARARAKRDDDLGISAAADDMQPEQRRWHELHRLARMFETETTALIARVTEAANAEMGSYGFRLQLAKRRRTGPGDLTSVRYLLASETGIEPSGTLNFSLRDTGNFHAEAEGIGIPIRLDGTERPSLDIPMVSVTPRHIEAAVLSFLKEILAGSQHAFAE